MLVPSAESVIIEMVLYSQVHLSDLRKSGDSSIIAENVATLNLRSVIFLLIFPSFAPFIFQNTVRFTYNTK